MSASRKTPDVAPGAVELIEESMHLLRAAPKGALAVYFAGSSAFVLGFLFFWAYVTWFTPPPSVLAWAACGLAALFAVMKTAHADFCSRLLAIRLRAPAPGFSAARLLGIAAGQMRIQAWGLILLPVAMILTVPFGWVYAYYQNASVLCESDDVGAAATEQAKIWPAQNHIGLLLISVLFLAAFMNVTGAFLMLPWLANKVLGIDSTFGINGWGRVNTTLVASVICLSWLLMDPVVKAFYVLRVFYGRARKTGEDLRVELQRARAAAGLRRAAALVALMCACCALPRATAAGVPPAPAAVSPEKLDASINEVMAGRDFQWRLRQPVDAREDEADGPIKSFVRKGVAILRAMTSGLGRFWRRITRWFDDLFPEKAPAAGTPSGGSSLGSAALRTLLYLFAAAVVVFVGVIVYLVITRARAERRAAVEAEAVAPAMPDVADENSHAGQLRTEEWLDVARSQLARGEWRLAWRALYLATLARLAAEGLVTLAKAKTNLDYEREVRRRALGRRDLTDAFASRRTAYEDVWYGQLRPEESKARAWLAEMEGHPLP